MNTPQNKPAFRVGLSKLSKSIQKTSATSTSSTTQTADQKGKQVATTPNETPEKTLKRRKTSIPKKKLEFAAQSGKSDNSSDTSTPKSTVLDELDLETLRVVVENQRKRIEILGRHEAEKKELSDLIERWKQAGSIGLDQLRLHLKEPKTDEEILVGFKMPHNVFT